ncbi:PD-(D/E)XK nuclease family protein [Streptosporangium roseum]|uniref:PD-(D/E)XK nuclease family protein n=1 Tax=Streptosporangium roseum TaxID=2001 RepID=UPI0033239F0A
MAWNDIPAKDDPNLTFQAYYVRLNILGSLLGRLSTGLLGNLWDVGENRQLSGLYRSALIGDLVADLIRALQLEEVTNFSPGVGNWFVHSGETKYTDELTAEIQLTDGKTITGHVRRECRVTNTASSNMRGIDDISLVVGRLISPSKFDLVAAGYRDPIRSLDWNARDNLQRNILTINSRRANYLPTIRYDGLSNEMVLMAAVHDTADRFAIAVRDQGTWKLLYDANGKPEHETRHQHVFRLFASLTFEALGIQVHPGANHGNGETDLTLTLQDSTCVIEFKKDREKKELQHGLTDQLPLYMQAARANWGYYMVMCHEREPYEVEDELKKLAQDRPETIDIIAIDCRRKKSASKAGL